MLADWIGERTTAIHHHALIDRKDGRTLSYAYMEVAPDAMKAILRARQNSILGFGKRARAVTITVSTQDALMREVCSILYCLILPLMLSRYSRAGRGISLGVAPALLVSTTAKSLRRSMTASFQQRNSTMF